MCIRDRNNLKQIGIALHNYAQTQGTLPSGHIEWSLPPAAKTTLTAATATGYYSCWSIDILPGIEQDNLYKTYKDYPTQNYGSNGDTTNAAFSQTYLAVYSCPSDPRQNQLVAPATLAPTGGGN